MKGKVRKKGKKGRKIGRTEVKCKFYRSRMTREKNKERKLKRHLEWQPNDLIAKAALKNVWSGVSRGV